MPNFSDYDEGGNMINPYFDSEPDRRNMDEFVSDYFDPEAKRTFFWKFDPYRDWLIYPPHIETEADADKMIAEWKAEEINMFKDIRGSDHRDLARKYMDKYEINEHIENLTKRFVKELHPKGWNVYRERDKLKEEIGKPVVKRYDENETYLVEFEVVQKYQFQAHTKMTIDDLFDHYVDQNTWLESPELIKKVIDGKVVPVGEQKIVDKSLHIIHVRGKSNTIVAGRMLKWLRT